MLTVFGKVRIRPSQEIGPILLQVGQQMAKSVQGLLRESRDWSPTLVGPLALSHEDYMWSVLDTDSPIADPRNSESATPTSVSFAGIPQTQKTRRCQHQRLLP